MATKKYYRLDGTIEDTDQIKSDELLSSINQRLQQEKPAMVSVAQTVKPTINTVDTTNTTKINPIVSVGKTLGNIATNMGEGALKTGESVLDTLNSLSDMTNNSLSYLGIKGLYGKDEAEKFKKESDKATSDFIKRNLINEMNEATGWNDMKEDWERGSLVKSGNIGGQIAQGIGGMVPSLVAGRVLGFIPRMTSTEGLSGLAKARAVAGNVAKTYVSQLPANAILTGSSYGGGMEQALNEGANLSQARKFGLANAAIEQGTEMMTGGVPGLGGKGGIDAYVEPLIGKTGGYLNPLLRAGYGAFGEGLEEYTSAMLEPLAKKIYTDEKIDWNEVRKNARQSGLVGAATGAILNSPTDIQNFMDVRNQNQVNNSIGDIKKAETTQQNNPNNEGWENQRTTNDINNEERIQENNQINQETNNINQESIRENQELQQVNNQQTETSGLSQKDFNEISRRYKDLMETTGFEEEINENATPKEMLGQIKQIKERYEYDGFLEQARWESPEIQKATRSEYAKLNRFINRFEGKLNETRNNISDAKNGQVNNQQIETPNVEQNDNIVKQLEEQGTKILNNAESERQGMIDNFESYLEENGIDNPTQEDINNSLEYYDAMDANDENIPFNQIQKKYDNTIKEYLKEKNNNIAEKIDEPVLKVETTGEKGKQYFQEQGADEKVAEILSEVPKEKANIKDIVNEVAGSLYRNIVSKGGELEKIAFKIGKPNVNYTYDKMLRAPAEGQYHLGVAQTDINYNKYMNFTDANGNKVSMSLNDIRNDAKKSGISEQTLNEYLAHKLNEYRYEEGKPVFSKNVTSEMSTEICNEIEKRNSQIKRIAENVWQFEQNQLKNLYDSGLISKARYKELSKNKHYVRIQRLMSTNRGTKITIDKNGGVQVNQPIQTAKGGNQNIMPIMEGIAKYTTDLVKMERTNESMRELGKALGMGSTNENIDAFTDEESFGVNPDLIKDNGDGTYTMTYFDKGVPTVVPINKGIYDAYVRNKAVSIIEGSKAFKTLSYAPRKVSQIFRSLTTNDNPLFMATNFFKDIGDAPFNSKYTTEFAKTYLSTEAFRQVAGNGVYNQLYNAAGGNSDSYFVDGNFTDKTTSKVKKGIEKLWSPIQKGNEIVETVPRVAEFIATIKANGYEVNANGELVAQEGAKPTKTSNEVMNEALYNAAEITTNFKRGGDVAKSLNRNGATFLNASIQGFDKQIRNFKDAFTSGNKKQIVNLLTKALIFGIAPTMLNDASYDDDDEYKEMQEYLKDNYYLFKGKDGQWIRIPKGRAMSVIGGAFRRGKNFIRGDKKAFEGFGKFAADQVAPNSVFNNNILSPLSQVKRNESWSGNKIIPDSYAKRPTEEQYNEKTDEISKFIGKAIKDVPLPESMRNFKSPLAIHYLLDQYTGAIGDTVLPMITEKSSSKYNPLIAPFVSKFTSDSVYSNKSVSDYYDKKTEIEIKKNSEKATPVDVAKNSYMTSRNLDIADLYKQQRQIQNDKSLSKSEKYDKAREKQKEINKTAKQIVKDVDNIIENEYYIKIGDYYYKKVIKDGEEKYIRDTSKGIPTGDKYALYGYFKSKYDKSKEESEG